MGYFYTMANLEIRRLAPDYSSAEGPHIPGERMQIAEIRKPRGTGSRLHTHPNEQFSFVVEGRLRVRIGEEPEQEVGQGMLLHVPAGVPHAFVAVSPGGARYVTLKDMSWGMSGEALDRTTAGPHVDPEPPAASKDLRARSGNNPYISNLYELEDIKIGPDYSTAHGGWVLGERIQVLLYNKAKGTGSRPHSHPNEQFIFVLTGKARAVVNGEEKIIGPGEVVHMPADSMHNVIALTGEDLVYLTAKDTTFGIHGIPGDGRNTGGFYEPGYKKD